MQGVASAISRQRRLALCAIAAGIAVPAWSQTPPARGLAPWSQIAERARGQRVYFTAWAGSERVNAYLQWADAELQRSAGVQLVHVKISDAAETVRRVRAEKAAAKNDGSVDLVWINGENFLAMKREALLFGPFSEALPNYRYVDLIGKPTTRVDFSEPVDGMEAPWGMAQLTFFADRKRVPEPPRSMNALLAFARAHPGRLGYPRPPDFTGSSFVKQALVELSPGRSALYQPWSAQAMAIAAAPLWHFLDALHPLLWRSGKQFLASAGALRQMVSDGELLIGISFNPNEAANEIAARRLPDSVVAYQHSGGTLANTHFLAIPFNASAREGAQVAANFLLSPAAQARKADIAQWGDPTVLALEKLPPAERALFATRSMPGQVAQTMAAIAEPHASWVDPLEQEWLRRYA